MGCGGSAGLVKTGGCPISENDPVAAECVSESVKPFAVIVWNATGLDGADTISKSDPYCIVRAGPTGSTWENKASAMRGRRSPHLSETNSPEWRFGVPLDLHDSSIENPEVHIRVYDKDWVSDDDYLGEVVRKVSECKGQGKQEAPLRDGKGTLFYSIGDVDMLAKEGIKPVAYFEKVAPIGTLKSVKLDDLTGIGPLLLGTAPLPEVLRGIFWLGGQKNSSALMSFGGPSRDGGGCSTGDILKGNQYKIRVSGDRVWAFADRESKSVGLTEKLDLVYNFIMDDPQNPTKCQIYPEARNLGLTLTAEWLLDFEAVLDDAADSKAAYPGSVVWRRLSFIFGQRAVESEYFLVQVIDGDGKRIEPAWSKFVEYQNSTQAGGSPGEVFYHEIES